MTATAIERFRSCMAGDDLIARLREGILGEGVPIEGPFGPKSVLYADYVASGRALAHIEDFVRGEILPYYANSHTEASFCGAYMTALRRESRLIIARHVQAAEDHAVVFVGSGATAGINHLVGILAIEKLARSSSPPFVFVGPYEHHSNLLPWRESGAEVIEVSEADGGGPDLLLLEHHLQRAPDDRLRVCAFSAASNVTGIVTDVAAVTTLAKKYDALSIWDYAAGGPYLPISMSQGGVQIDAIVLSPHKFVGGPGASGILVIKRALAEGRTPTWPGGGTVSYVSSWAQDYLADVSDREEAGTPNVVGDIRAALVFVVKEAIGQDFIERRNAWLNERALQVWTKNPRLMLLGIDKRPRLPIFSFRVLDGRGGFVHHQLFTRILSDRFGIQARGGCACAGPYGHRLLNIDREESERLRRSIQDGDNIVKPGWVRLNFSYLLSNEKVDTIIRCVDELASESSAIASGYVFDRARSQFCHRGEHSEA